MIEISRRHDTWECYVDGRLWEWNDDLQTLLKLIAKQGEAIEEDINE